jgi:hypothetical protein
LQIEVGPTLLPQICSLLQFYTAAKRNDTIEELLRYLLIQWFQKVFLVAFLQESKMPPKKQLIFMMVLDFMKEVHSHSTFVSIHQESKMPPKKQLLSMMVLDFMKEVHSHSTFVSIHQESKMPQENSLVSLMMLDFMEQVDRRKCSRW